jgi:recombination DNA repair RAD52 pathway protein
MAVGWLRARNATADKVAGIEIDIADQSPLVVMLLTVSQKQDAEIQRRKKTTTRSKNKPSRLLKQPSAEDQRPPTLRRKQSAGRWRLVTSPGLAASAPTGLLSCYVSLRHSFQQPLHCRRDANGHFSHAWIVERLRSVGFEVIVRVTQKTGVGQHQCRITLIPE